MQKMIVGLVIVSTRRTSAPGRRRYTRRPADPRRLKNEHVTHDKGERRSMHTLRVSMSQIDRVFGGVLRRLPGEMRFVDTLGDLDDRRRAGVAR